MSWQLVVSSQLSRTLSSSNARKFAKDNFNIDYQTKAKKTIFYLARLINTSVGQFTPKCVIAYNPLSKTAKVLTSRHRGIKVRVSDVVFS